MPTLRSFLFAGVLAAAAAGATLAAPSAHALEMETRMQLQAAMQRHISRTTIAGVYPKMNLATGQVEKLHPAAGHPRVVTLGEQYVLCSEFRDADGKQVSVDFYLARDDQRWTVFQVEFDNRAPLKALMSSGVAKMNP